MAYIKTLKDNELIGGQDNTDVYPITSTQAVYSQKKNGSAPEGKKVLLEERLTEIENQIDTPVGTDDIVDGAVVTRKIADNAITTSKIDNGAVTSEKIASNAVTNDKIANGTITGDKFTDDSIDGSKIKDNSVQGSKLADGAIESIDLQDNTLSGSKLADNSVDGVKLVDGAVTSAKLKDNSIDGSKIADATIQSLDIKDGTISGAKLANNTITSDKLANGSIDNNKIANNTITGDKFLDESISGEKIQPNSIHGNKIETGTVDGADIIAGTLHGSKIADMSVDGDKLADDSIETRHIKSNTISGSKIVTNSIDSTKIRNNSLIGENFEEGVITTAKIADNAVTNSKIANNAITNAKIVDEAITTDKLANSSIGGTSIADNAITNAKLQDDSIVNRNIATGTLTGDKFVDNTITGDKIIDNTIPGSKIKDGTIENVDIKDNTLSGTKLIDNSVSGSKIADNAITSAHLLNNSIPASKIQDGTIESIDIKDGTLSGSKLKDNTITGAKLADNDITSAKLSNNSITTDKIVNLAVTEAKLGTGSVTADKITDGSVTETKLGTGAVTANKILNNAVTTAKLADNAVTSDKIANNSIITDKIVNLAVTEDKISDNAVTTSKIVNDAITTGKLADSAVTTAKILNGNITTDKIKDANVTTEKLANGAVTENKLADGAVTTDKIDNLTISEDKIVNGAVTENKISNGAVTENKLGTGSVTTGKIVNNAITENKIGAGAVTNTKILDGSVTEGKIGTGAITEGKIGSFAVTNTKIANDAVTTAKLNDGSVTTDKILDNNVTTTKIADGAITAAKIVDNSITTDKIADLNVTTAKIADEAVTEDKLADGAITSDKIADDAITELQTIMDAVPTAGSVKPVQSGGVQNELALGAVYDVSAKNPTAGTNSDGKWESLSVLLSDANLNTLIPTNVRKGGMSIKFVQTTLAKYTVVKTEELTEQPTGTEIQNDPGITSGTYEASQLSAFSTLPATLNSSLTYYLTVTETVDEQEVTTYTSWVITYVQSSDNKYMHYRYTVESIESADFTNEANWELDVTKKNLSEDFLGLLSEIKDFTTGNYSIQSTGKFGKNNIYNHAIIPVNEGEIYYLIGTHSFCRAAFATSNSSSSGADIPLVNGTSVIPMPATVQYYKLVIPAGCTYLLFNAGEYYGSRLFRHYNSIDEATENLKKSIEDVDSKLPRLSFIGKVIDWTSHYAASFGPLAGSFLAGHKYRAWIKNPNDISQQNKKLDGFTIFAYNNPNQERDTQNKIRITCFTTVKVNQTVEAYYDFELPTEATVTYQDVEVTVTGVQEWWLQAYGRANDGVEIDIRIEDISLLTVIDDNLDSTDSTHALSAKQGSVLNDKIHNTDVSLEELSTEILGGYIIEDTISKDNITKSEIGASMSTTDWAKIGSAASLVIGLADYKAEGFNYLHITPQESYNTYITFTKIALPESNVSSAVLMSTYLSSGMGGALRLKYDSNSGDNQVAIPDDAMYVYIEKRFKSDNENTDRLPDDYSITKEFYNESIIDQKIKESLHNTIGMAVSPTPPAVTNIKIKEDGSFVKQDNIFTTAMIFGDFACKLREGYDINRIMKCDTAGNIVNYNYATDTLPNAVMDGAGYEGHKNRRVYGTSFKSLEYGIIIEIKSDGSNVQIAPSDVFEYFYWKGTLTSELETLPRYNGNSYTDSAIDADRVFTKNSIQSALKRARIAAMIPWITQRYVMPTQEAWRDIQFLQGTVQHGAPYSRANVRERWLGIDVSPETFITASMNPYSVLYTEKIGDGTAANPFASEYGITEYGSNHGVPYYGLVCSAYASYILGFNEPAATDGFPNDSRLYVISKHSEIESGCTEAPVDARTIPALSCITTPGHTYMVIDFLQVEGERIAAIVAEETSPMIRVGLYPIDRLQERWDYEYQYYCTESGGYTGDENVIEVTLIKPSSLDERKDNSVWDVSQMYSINTNKDVMLGICRQDMKIDSNVMFYMGEKAVVMEYDDVKAIKNDRQWLVIKPETYTKVQVERWDESNNQWVIITSSYDIATNKESYSDNNTDYFKIDVTSVCSTYGIYRACLVNGNEHTGYTQWMVLNCLIKKDPNNNNRIIWESANSELSIDSVNYAKAVAVRNTLSNGAGSTVNSEVYAARGYIIINPDTADYLKVSLQCKWGIATRFTRYQLL